MAYISSFSSADSAFLFDPFNPINHHECILWALWIPYFSWWLWSIDFILSWISSLDCIYSCWESLLTQNHLQILMVLSQYDSFCIDMDNSSYHSSCAYSIFISSCSSVWLMTNKDKSHFIWRSSIFWAWWCYAVIFEANWMPSSYCLLHFSSRTHWQVSLVVWCCLDSERFDFSILLVNFVWWRPGLVQSTGLPARGEPGDDVIK